MNMDGKMIGVALTAQSSREALDQVQQLDYLGIPAAWSTTGGSGGDAITFFAAALMKSRDVLLGTSIIPTYPRHPLVVAQQVQALDNLDPGRFRLGVGPSHQATIEGAYGIDFKAPLGHPAGVPADTQDSVQRGPGWTMKGDTTMSTAGSLRRLMCL